MPSHDDVADQPPGMDAVRTAIAALDIDDHEVWADYLGLLGQHSYREFVEAIHSGGRFSAGEYNKVAAALNDLFVERGLNHPVSYMDISPVHGQPDHERPA